MLTAEFIKIKEIELHGEMARYRGSGIGYHKEYVAHVERLCAAYEKAKAKGVRKLQYADLPERGSYYRKEFETKVHEQKGWKD